MAGRSCAAPAGDSNLRLRLVPRGSQGPSEGTGSERGRWPRCTWWGCELSGVAAWVPRAGEVGGDLQSQRRRPCRPCLSLPVCVRACVHTCVCVCMRARAPPQGLSVPACPLQGAVCAEGTGSGRWHSSGSAFASTLLSVCWRVSRVLRAVLHTPFQWVGPQGASLAA